MTGANFLTPFLAGQSRLNKALLLQSTLAHKYSELCAQDIHYLVGLSIFMEHAGINSSG